MVDEQDEGWAVVDGRHVSTTSNGIKIFYQYTRWCWVFLALASLAVQATRTADVSEMHETILDNGELAITLAFDIEIIVRILAELPAWRGFFMHGNNWLDLILAIGSSVIQIPVIHQSAVYPWLTIFQLARFYRVILEVPRMRPLMVRVLLIFGGSKALSASHRSLLYLVTCMVWSTCLSSSSWSILLRHWWQSSFCVGISRAARQSILGSYSMHSLGCTRCSPLRIGLMYYMKLPKLKFRLVKLLFWRYS